MTAAAFAKVNLSLEVLGVRPDGYHEIRSVVLPISLFDTMEFDEAEDGAVASDSPYGETDLAFRAAKALLAAGARGGVSIKTVKRIPEGGGLGGGSADAAATLLALNAMWKFGKSPEELAAIGANVGSDVPSLVLAHHYRRPVMMEGRGERVLVLGDDEIASLDVGRFIVVANPGVVSSTADVYARCRSVPVAAQGVANGLQKAACELHPEISVALDALSAAGAKGVRMTGSGSSVFGFADDADFASQIVAKMAKKKISSFFAFPLAHGSEFLI